MKGLGGQILYVGKAKSLRDRVHSYFAPITTLGPKTAVLVSQISTIDHIDVQSEIEALLLESRLIKKFRPPFNIASKDDKSPYYIHITREPFPKPIINHESARSLAGPFLNRHIPAKILRQFRRIAPYCTSPRPVSRPCLYSHLGLCSPCPAAGDAHGYRKNITRLKSLLSGQISRVKSELTKLMNTSSHQQDFENAAIYRDHLQNLEWLLAAHTSPEEYLVNPNLIQDKNQSALESLKVALGASHLALESLGRIEFFDNAHLQGTSPTSAMTVAIDGQVTHRHYRHFTLKSGSDDVSLMAEVLTRRLKRTDWPTPDLVVLDGGLPQLTAAHNLQPTTYNLPSIIALAKRDEIIYLSNGQQIKLPKAHPGLLLLMHLRDEAHRFSRRLHHLHRSKKLMLN
ncbi:hypothetical protein A2899_00940 [Candidatus Amesbacteria bacterium RIFCSPLOWO2_01_FULL_49_25]|uniref:Excinuclease ABC subunit C n=1 Tax=Candidatus Amesbacteria bacterium RIFCSPHIGHO2_01_FULL_48_32b TaxID=1797253 RepID=A0A1F4YFL3_9BACT|nr:MAG: hypothetical protein A2876_00090 [Candidatus Amesbacteria bacterium RIFCSPHIGHO2_01_FULL_48_32b]OGD07132.1 MAG: hypothetical protein A2899_00940 [Candidatus Amesbacteria bacterium RIFCSPLOWO2_01_FULL_49_25]